MSKEEHVSETKCADPEPRQVELEVDDEDIMKALRKHKSADVKTPSGKTDKAQVKPNKNGTIGVIYNPTEIGHHELWQQPAEGEAPPKKPLLLFNIEAIPTGYVTAHGPGLLCGNVNEPAFFTVSTKDAGAGNLTFVVAGPSRAKIDCQNKGGMVHVSYLPTVVGDYKISVRYDGKDIQCSPWTAKVTAKPPEKKKKK